jgi:hypothetical protein
MTAAAMLGGPLGVANSRNLGFRDLVKLARQLPVLCGRRSAVVGNADALSGKANQNGFAERCCITVQAVPAFEILKCQFVGEEGLGIQFSDEPGSLLHQGRRDKAYTVIRIFSDVRRTR